MRIVKAAPPLFDEIDKAFDIAGKPVIFAWGDAIYNPEGTHVTLELIAHETVHGERQGADPQAWWRRYIADPAFRLAEEIPAHQAEYRAFRDGCRDRNACARYLHRIAMRLSSPLYGGMIAYPQARIAIAA